MEGQKGFEETLFGEIFEGGDHRGGGVDGGVEEGGDWGCELLRGGGGGRETGYEKPHDEGTDGEDDALLEEVLGGVAQIFITHLLCITLRGGRRA